MIQQKTLLKTVDNSGAKLVRVIKVLGGFKKNHASLGDMVVVSVQKLRNKSKKNTKVKQKEIYKALIVKTKIGVRRKSGQRTRFFINAVALLNSQNNPVGTRILEPMPRELKSKKFQKLFSISKGLV